MTHDGSSGFGRGAAGILGGMTNLRGLAFEISPITAEQALPMRREILRPGAPDSELRWPTDDQEDTLHVGCFTYGEIVGIASVHREEPPWIAEYEGGWRLRGMATSPVLRRRGVGRWMVATCMQHAFDHGGTLLWCNARTPAVRFYEALGFEVRGEEFEIPGAGPHYVMFRPL